MWFGRLNSKGCRITNASVARCAYGGRAPKSLHWQCITLIACSLLGHAPDSIGKPTRAGEFSSRPETQAFIQEMIKEYGFNERKLNRLFAQVKREPTVVEAMTRPILTPPKWHEYQARFLSPARVAGGLAYWQRNYAALQRAQGEFGVPPEVVVAIVGVETFYGRNTGRYRVIDALATLAFDYPRRAEYFRRELADFLLLAREQRFSPLLPEGSYAGAMGLPQFMPSSYRRYGVDFSGDRKVDLWREGPDVIGSVANFLAHHGWRPNQPVMTVALAGGTQLDEELTSGMSPRRALSDWAARKITLPPDQDGGEDLMAQLVLLEESEGPSYRFGFDNFQVLMRYNRSRLYAAAVWELAQSLRLHREQSSDRRELLPNASLPAR